MNAFTPFTGFDPLDGDEPHVGLSVRNPVRPDLLDQVSGDHSHSDSIIRTETVNHGRPVTQFGEHDHV